MKVCNLQVAMNDLAARVEQPQGFVVIFQAGGQGQLHVCTQAHCNTQNTGARLYSHSTVPNAIKTLSAVQIHADLLQVLKVIWKINTIKSPDH